MEERRNDKRRKEVRKGKTKKQQNEEAINGSDKSMTMKTEEERIKTQHQKQEGKISREAKDRKQQAKS